MTKEAIQVADWTLTALRYSTGLPETFNILSVIHEDEMNFENDIQSTHYVYETWCKRNKLSSCGVASRANSAKTVTVKIVVILKLSH